MFIGEHFCEVTEFIHPLINLSTHLALIHQFIQLAFYPYIHPSLQNKKDILKAQEKAHLRLYSYAFWLSDKKYGLASLKVG